MSDLYHSEVKSMARDEMDKWGLREIGWKFEINSTVRRLGQCSYRKRTIYVSSNNIKYNTEKDILNTILHEIAHALHYQHYVDRGMEREFFATRYTGRKFVQKIPPHGREWKRFAVLVGANPVATSSTCKVHKSITHKWYLVTVSNGTVNDEGYGCQRFLSNLSGRWMRGRKNETKGRLYLVPGHQWKEYLAGKLSISDLSFHQNSNQVPAESAYKLINIHQKLQGN